jgi:hypothetical protein
MATIPSERLTSSPPSRRRIERGRRFWKRFIAEWPGSGVTQAEYCRRAEVPLGSFCWWKHRLNRERVTFLPVNVVSERSNSSDPSTRSVESTALEVVVQSGRVLRVRPECDLKFLKRVVEALEDSAC